MSQSPPEFLFDGPQRASQTIVLAHGAGAAMDTPFMNAMAEGLAKYDFRVVRFEFPYMAARRASGSKRGPDRANVLIESWRAAISKLGPSGLVIGGKSMGGRIASMVADEAGVAGVVCLGYPFHPVGKPQQLRVEHLQQINTPTLILQGERDPFGRPDEVLDYALGNKVAIHWLTDGDHSFKPRKASGSTLDENLDEAIRVTANFVQRQAG